MHHILKKQEKSFCQEVNSRTLPTAPGSERLYTRKNIFIFAKKKPTPLSGDGSTVMGRDRYRLS